MSGSHERRAPALTMASPFTEATALWGDCGSAFRRWND
jgi:hypothetical protein